MTPVRGDLPTGTVTFLFTDVEGSTKLLHELGAEAYAQALAEHRRVIRDACAAEGGVEVDTQGDAFFFAFPTAPGAMAAADGDDQALRAGPIHVRIGLHTGTPLLAEEGYVGGDVHRAARIAAVGHGGQVLVSSATAPLVEVELTDLGEHRLKDLSAPERIYQLGDRGIPSAEEPLPDQPPHPVDAVSRKRGRARRGRLAPSLFGHAPAHAHRARGNGQDATRRTGRRSRLGPLLGRRLVDPARPPPRPQPRPRHGSTDRRLEERPGRAHPGQGDALPPRQLRAGRGGSSRRCRATCLLPEPRPPRHEQGAAACNG